ncbi:putative chromosome segregation [Trypoxylus dichotomus]
MEKVHEYILKIPDMLTEFINGQAHAKACDDYFIKVENEIKHFKKYGTFKIPQSLNSDIETQKTRRAVLNETSAENRAQIKLERISEISSNQVVLQEAEKRESLKENIKIEKPEMPPPQMPVKKNRRIKKEPSVTNTRSTRSKTSKKDHASTDSVLSRDSDVVLQKQVVETVTISDSDEESDTNSKKLSQKLDTSDGNKTETEEVSVRTTRTKTRKKLHDNNEDNGKRSRSPSTDIEIKSKSTQAIRQSKRKRSEELPIQEDTSLYEDAVTNFPNYEQNKIVNSTFVKEKVNETYTSITKSNEANEGELESQMDKRHTITKDGLDQAALSNQTIVVTDPKIIKNASVTSMNLKDIMTDDEDDNITVTLPKKVTKTIKNGAKAIFSPFAGSPVKKRVEAFEKLGAEIASEIPVRTTRTKTKIINEKQDEQLPHTPGHQPTTGKEDKYLTPQMASRYLTAISNSTTKASKKFINESFISSKSASALKASQQEYKDREIRRREKEAEAMRKREALMLAQTEEKKKKRLEKQTKAQQVREALEKSKLKTLEEVERTKEEKRRQVLAEKQEKLKRQQEEAERRRLEAQRKAAEEKRKEEERRKAIEEEQEKLKQQAVKKALDDEKRKVLEYKKKARQLPIYLRQKAPLLPTDDCYDSDDENRHKQVRKPSWTSRDRLEQKLNVMKNLSKNVVSSFFVLDVTTPDLQDIFEYIDPRKLKRTSSANWKIPPRFTLMPDTIDEDGEEE